MQRFFAGQQLGAHLCLQTAGASVGMIAAIVVGTVAALVVALGMYVAYRRRRRAAHRPRKSMAAARQALDGCPLSSGGCVPLPSRPALAAS